MWNERGCGGDLDVARKFLHPVPVRLVKRAQQQSIGFQPGKFRHAKIPSNGIAGLEGDVW
jgi:hypothetical protein